MNIVEKISVVIADNQPLYRLGLKQLLLQDDQIKSIEEVGNDIELTNHLESSPVDIIILDYNPTHFNADILKSLFQKHPDSKVIIISSQEKKWHIFKSLEFNVFAYLTKECGKADVLMAIQSAMKGEKFFCSFIMNVLLDNNAKDHDSAHCEPSVLTSREIEITQLVSRGKKNKEIANDLNLSPHTIHTHRKNIMKKLGVRSASELTAYAMKAGIVEE